jgi:hypothetical protein
LVLERFLPACTGFLDEERTRRAGLGVVMALMFDLLVAAGWSTSAFVVARRRASAAWLRRMQDCSSAIASDFFKHRFETAATRPFVAEGLTSVIPAFQCPATNSEADVLRLDVLFSCHAIFPFGGLAFTGFLLTRAAALSAFVSTTVESRAADSSTRWRFLRALMADTVRCSSTTTT